VEVADERFIDLPDTVRQVDTATSEIIDGTAKTLPAAPAGDAGSAGQTATAAPPASSGAPPDDPGTCPDHGVPNIRLKSKRNPKWHDVGHFINKEQGGGICYKKDQPINKPDETAAKQQPADGEFIEQDGAERGTEPPTETGVTDGSGDGIKPTPAASAQETDEGKEDGPDRAAINSLAQQLYGPDWQPALRNFLKSTYGLQSRNAIKEAQIPDIIKKLTAMVNAMK
jgi:hypothetical protein